MKGLVITNKGIEDISAKEISQLIKCKNIIKNEQTVEFEFENLIDLCSVCYKSQSIKKGVLLLSKFNVDKTLKNSTSQIIDSLVNVDFKNWLPKKCRIDCVRTGEHEFSSVEISHETSKYLFKKIKETYNHESKTDFDNPDIIFFIYIHNEQGYFGIDFCEKELDKRQYKIFNHVESLNSITAYSLVKLSDYNIKKTMLDPFMGSGIIVIEAALFCQNFSGNYYDKDRLFFTNFDFFKKYGEEKFFKIHDKLIMDRSTNIYGYDNQLRYLKATQKNAKLAGISKNINLSKIDIEWLDTKFEKNSVDLIVSDPPRESKNKDLKKLKKTYNELFYQANYVLKKNGSLTLLVKTYSLLNECAQMHKFKITKKYLINQGKEEFTVLKFCRSD